LQHDGEGLSGVIGAPSAFGLQVQLEFAE
jgi:hypothetical protein